MGTNYYLHKNICPHCERHDELHIGKSSGGWCFSLHIIPEDNINDLPDWVKLFEEGVIFSEYGSETSTKEMLDIITNRSWGDKELLRHRIDRHCTGHGKGTWDLLPGEFS